VVKQYPELYTREVLGLEGDQPFAQAFARRYAESAERDRPHVATMQKLSRDIRGQLDDYLRSFRREFPDFRYTGRIYFLNSFDAFDGATREVGGKTALLFGVETIARINGPGADMAPFFHHELFHVYQGQFNDDGDGELYRSLWNEGLAVYVSRVLNPNAPDEQIFGRPLDMPARTRAALPKVAREFREKMDSTSRTDYARFFHGRRPAEAESPDIPPRSGYYLGYLVAERLARQHDLQWLAHAKTKSLRAEIEQALRQIEAGK
jgi:hypothetical protein